MLEKYPKPKVMININSFNGVEICYNYGNVCILNVCKIENAWKIAKKPWKNKLESLLKL